MTPRASAPGKRRLLFHMAAVVIVLVAAAAMLFALDGYVHYRLAPYAAVNIWGYRGAIVGRKRLAERRVVIIGGSTVFGVGFPPEHAFPAILERKLQKRSNVPVSVVNLGFPGENAYAYRADLEDYRYLNPDVVVFYGNNNLVTTAPIVLRRQSALFRLAGYYPMLPTALHEKAMALRYGGDLGAAYRNDKVVFRPGLATRTGAAALAEAAAVANAVQRVFGPLTRTAAQPPVEIGTCGPPWTEYCDAMNDAIAYARSKRQRVLVVNYPYESDRHIEQQQALRAMLRQQFGSDANVRYLDLGWALDRQDRALTYDGTHLTPSGNERIADNLLEPVRALLTADSNGSSGPP